MSATPPTLHVVTVATNIRPEIGHLLHSCEQNNVVLNVRGMYDPKFQAWGKGFGRKIALYQAFVESVDPNDIVLCVDAFDTVLTKKAAFAEEFLTAFATFDAHVVISSEMICGKHCVGTCGRTTDPGSINKYVCSGAFAGKAGALTNLYRKFPFVDADDDQVYMGEAWLKSDNVVLDARDELFMNMAGHPQDLDVTHITRPFVLHYNSREKKPIFTKDVRKLYPDANSVTSVNWWMWAAIALIIILIVLCAVWAGLRFFPSHRAA
jgi:hypothetical protein